MTVAIADGILAAQRGFLKTLAKSIVPDVPPDTRSATPDCVLPMRVFEGDLET